MSIHNIIQEKSNYSSLRNNEHISVSSPEERKFHKRREQILDSYFNLKDVNYPVFITTFRSKNPKGCPDVIHRLSSRYKPLRQTELNLNEVKNCIQIQNFQFQLNPNDKIITSMRKISIPKITSDLKSKTLLFSDNSHKKVKKEDKGINVDKNLNTNLIIRLNNHRRSKSSYDLKRINISPEGISKDNINIIQLSKGKTNNMKSNQIIFRKKISRNNELKKTKSSNLVMKNFRYHLIKSHYNFKHFSKVDLKDKLQLKNTRNNDDPKQYNLKFETQKVNQRNTNYDQNSNIIFNNNYHKNVSEDNSLNPIKCNRELIKSQNPFNVNNQSIFSKCIERYISDDLKLHSFYNNQKYLNDAKNQKKKILFTYDLKKNMPYFLKYLHINN